MAIPQEFVCKRGKNKYLAFRAMEGLMPECARASATKVTPYPLLSTALKDDISEFVRAFINQQPKVERYLGESFVNRLSRVSSGKEHIGLLWYAVGVALWLLHSNP